MQAEEPRRALSGGARDKNPFVDGDQGSRSQMVGNLEELRARGQGVIDSLSSIQLKTLLEVQKRLSALNGRRQRAFRVPSPDLAARFLVSDFLGTDQAQTSGSVRIDSASATLRERAESGQINIKSTRFSTSSGTIQKAGDLYQVTNDSNLSPPVGTFDLELDPPLNPSLLSFDVVSTPSTPEVSVGVSGNGVTFSPAASLALNGYRINAWLVPATVRFVRLARTGTQEAFQHGLNPGCSPSTGVLSPDNSAAARVPAKRPGGAPDAVGAMVEGWRREGRIVPSVQD